MLDIDQFSTSRLFGINIYMSDLKYFLLQRTWDASRQLQARISNIAICYLPED